MDAKVIRFLDPDGRLLAEAPPALAGPGVLEDLYRAMLRTRLFDAKAVALQRSGRLGTFASSLGQEGVSIGVGHAMAPDDVLLPAFRDHGTQLLRGVTLEELFLYWGGDERGSDFHGPREDFPVSITVGGHAPHAAGVALAFKLRQEPRAAVCIFGDGASSKGDVYEAMNVAGVWQLPVIFVINNNQWAISTPRAAQTAAATLAQKAVACGFEGMQVDGNDVIAVAAVMDEALRAARGGGGPRLVECLTYRMADHTTADDASRYRDPAEVAGHEAEDPLRRLGLYLRSLGRLDDTLEARWRGQEEAQVEAAARHYLETPLPPPDSIFRWLYGTMPEEIRRQREQLEGFMAGTDDG